MECACVCAAANQLCAPQKLTEEEQKLFRLYGKLPTHKNVLTKMQKVLCAGVPADSPAMYHVWMLTRAHSIVCRNGSTLTLGTMR